MILLSFFFFFFFFNDTATTEIYTLSLHDALPISSASTRTQCPDSAGTSAAAGTAPRRSARRAACAVRDRKSTRLNSSHLVISYAVFCLKKKKKIRRVTTSYLDNSVDQKSDAEKEH